MRQIAQGFFEQSPYMAGPAFTLVLFFLMFVAVIVVLFRGRTSRFDQLAALPLEDANEKPVSHD